MDFIHIVPTSLLGRYNYRMEFCEVAWCKESQEYWDYFKKLSIPVIVDNSTAVKEGPSNDEDIMRVARTISHPWVVLPDYIGNYSKTKGAQTIFMERNSLFIASIRARGGKVVGVIQGDNLWEYGDHYSYIDQHVDVIGIPFRTLEGRDDVYQKNVSNNDARRGVRRIILLSWLLEKGIINRQKHHHLFGVANLSELMLSSRFSFVKSADSSFLYTMSMNGKSMFADKDHVDFFVTDYADAITATYMDENVRQVNIILTDFGKNHIKEVK